MNILLTLDPADDDWRLELEYNSYMISELIVSAPHMNSSLGDTRNSWYVQTRENQGREKISSESPLKAFLLPVKTSIKGVYRTMTRTRLQAFLGWSRDQVVITACPAFFKVKQGHGQAHAPDVASSATQS